MTIDYKSRLQALPGASQLTQQHDGWWMDAPRLDVQALANCMKEWEAHFSTMTGTVSANDEIEVIYHYYLDHQAYNFKVITRQNSLPTISLILPAANWIEREIMDLYRIEFKDHPNPKRLIRPAQIEPGLFREQGGAAEKRR